MSRDSHDQEKKEELEKSWSDLPQDLIETIKLSLFAGDLFAFNSTCKRWRSFTPSIVRPLPPPINCPHRQSPCLMFIQKRGICNFFHPIYNDFFCMEIPEIADARIRFSKYGWLLLSRNETSLFFFHPFTREKMELPMIPFDYGFNSLCFTAPPTSADCIVMGVSSMPTISIGVARPGENSWFTIDYGKKFWASECNPILYKGQFYCLGTRGDVGRYNLRDHSWDTVVRAFDTQFSESIHQGFFAEWEGKLLAIFVHGTAREVNIFRLDDYRMVFRPVHTLGDKMLFVSRGSSFAETASVNGMANKIYFPKFYGKDGVFYSLSTKKYHSFNGMYSSKMAYKLKDLPLSAWIKPSYEMVH